MKVHIMWCIDHERQALEDLGCIHPRPGRIGWCNVVSAYVTTIATDFVAETE